jgi:intracellular sulfur oxidation DsrE/DsrF family protein
MVFAQTTPIKIVFDVTSSDEKVHQSALRHVNLMSKSYPESQFEVVVYSGALNMLVKGKSSVTDQVEKFADNDNISFVVCAMSMKRHDITKAHLLSGVEPVPDGILEIYQKQSEGWGYIKEAN